MLRFLKELDPFRLILVAILALAARIFWFSDDTILIPSLRWLSAGEMMADHKTLYKQIWTTLEPFSAGAYYFIFTLFGKSFLALKIISALLCITQAFLFNHYVSQAAIYNQKTSYPALFYILFSSISYDFYILSPVQMGLTFMLPVMYILFKDVRIGDKPNNHFTIGFFIGIASLFHLPFAAFILFVIYSLIVFSSFDVKRVFQLVFAFAFPWGMVFMYYYLNGALFETIENLLIGSVFKEKIVYVNLFSIIQVALPSVVIAVLSFLMVSSRGNFLNYQYSCMKIMILWFFNGLFSFWLVDEWSYFNIYLLIPTFVFFTTFMFLKIERFLIREIAFWIIAGVFIMLHIHNVSIDESRTKNNTSSILIAGNSVVRFNGDPVENATVLILGDKPTALMQNKQNTVYADWSLAKRHFSDLNNYANVSAVYTNVYESNPDYIFDEAGVMPVLLERIPALENRYEASYDQKIYRRKK